MNYYLKESNTLEKFQKNAGSKARNDVEAILSSLGWQPKNVELPYKETDGILESVLANIKIYRYFRKQLWDLKKGDTLLVQFPPRSHSMLFPFLFTDLRRRSVDIIFLIHDLERPRFAKLSYIKTKKRVRIFLEETLLLRCGDKIICHNERMKDYLKQQKIPATKIVPLGIFDYLTDALPATGRKLANEVVFAGNLSLGKSAFLADLKDIPDTTFHLYGLNYEEQDLDNVVYKGAFAPEDLVSNLEGSFGLVWDGTSIETCDGIFGEYLRLNDPHKFSLYLAAGLPVIVWDESALADFVRAGNVGLTVPSLTAISAEIGKLSGSDYRTMCENAQSIAARLREGGYLKTALGLSE